jgi:hypothetical protein
MRCRTGKHWEMWKPREFSRFDSDSELNFPQNIEKVLILIR